MKAARVPENFYLSLTEFLLLSKRQVFLLSEEYGLSSMQTLTLLLLKDEPRPMKNLCDLYNCDASNITGIIDGLEEKKLVSRQPHPKDRRIKMICLEKAGRKLQAKLAKELSQRSDQLFQNLDAQEIHQLTTLIQKATSSEL